MELGRIAAWHTHTLGQVFVDGSCEVDGVRNLDCIFEPLTHCPRTSMRNDNSISLGFKESYGRSGKCVGAILFDWTSQATDELAHGRCGAPPSVLSKELDRQLPFRMTQPAKKYYWRSQVLATIADLRFDLLTGRQASAYVMRLNAAALAELYAMRMSASKHTGFTLPSAGSGSHDRPTTKTIEMPYPLPKGAISMHVRFVAAHSLAKSISQWRLGMVTSGRR